MQKEKLTGAARSKTMWFAAALAALGVVQAQLDVFKDILTPQMYGYILVGVAAAIAGLRVLTSAPLEDK